MQSESNVDERRRTSISENFFFLFQQYLDEYPKVFVVGADNVGSRQMQRIRLSLRGHAGRNTERVSSRTLKADDLRLTSDHDGKEHHDEKNHSWTSGEKCQLGETVSACL